MLNDFDFSKKSEDGHQQVCKICKERKEHKICTCPCDNCKDEKLLQATYSLMELVLTRIDEGLVVPNDFSELAVSHDPVRPAR